MTDAVLCLTVLGLWLSGINLAAFAAFGLDKRRAAARQWRIPEARLLLLAAAGGSPGALLGMLFFHHKTRKWKFRLLVPAMLVLQCALPILYRESIYEIFRAL
ncbi:MAG: DUF1294 domain-containing protein [Clostridiales bacterium]|nr:DUF1294 domain-containing protein [Clostridiales bacterium]